MAQGRFFLEPGYNFEDYSTNVNNLNLNKRRIFNDVFYDPYLKSNSTNTNQMRQFNNLKKSTNSTMTNSTSID